MYFTFTHVLEHQDLFLYFTLIFQASAPKRKFPNSQSEGERQNNDDISTPIPQKYARFETQNDVHCNVKPNFSTAEDSEPSLWSNNMFYAAVNGHAADFVKTEDLSKTNSSYNTPVKM